MKRTGLVFDERYLLHKTSSFHPEIPERLTAAYKGIEDAGLLPYLTRINPLPASQSWIERVHHVNYILRFEEACLMGFDEFDHPDNQLCRDTFDIARLAVGGVMEAVKGVMKGEIDNAFCAVRPPGHHAEVGKAMGFCYFNNVAVAARYLRDEWRVQRVGIVDFDVHHGNGTQHIFEHDPTVFYYSIHEHPSFAYPGTGREFEKGIDAGYGYTLNSPVLPGEGDEAYKKYMERDLLPAFADFKPEFILVSAGFDGHDDDDMSDIRLSSEGYSWIMETLMDLANTYAGGRIVSVLEGGYCLARLPELIRNHIQILLNG
jgi:acetoin utilization deacetylase AcuC-like enzyme